MNDKKIKNLKKSEINKYMIKSNVFKNKKS